VPYLLPSVLALQLNRQDIAGWSSETTPSNYGLLGETGTVQPCCCTNLTPTTTTLRTPATGPPGWRSTALDGPPLPHPDYFLALLFKQVREELRRKKGGRGRRGGGGGG
jgi:hypothetical protein